MSDAPDRSHAIVPHAWVPVRAEPSHRSELVSQWLCGETLFVDEIADGWLRARGPDGYHGWTARPSLLLCDSTAVQEWEARASWRSLGVAVRPDVSDQDSPRWLPWGARVGATDATRVELPTAAQVAVAEPDRLVGPGERMVRFPPDGASVIRTARRWIGTPYMWGGRTMVGADCSGFVQAVYGLHDRPLPRDSSLQRDIGPDVAIGAPAFESLQPADLLFFAPEDGVISHVAMSLGGTEILHASATNGAVRVNDLAGTRPLEIRLARSLVAATRSLESSCNEPSKRRG